MKQHSINELSLAQKIRACFRMLFKNSKPTPVIQRYSIEKDTQQSWPNGADRKVVAHYHSKLTGLELQRVEHFFESDASFLSWFQNILKYALAKKLQATAVLECHSRKDGQEFVGEIVL